MISVYHCLYLYDALALRNYDNPHVHDKPIICFTICFCKNELISVCCIQNMRQLHSELLLCNSFNNIPPPFSHSYNKEFVNVLPSERHKSGFQLGDEKREIGLTRPLIKRSISMLTMNLTVNSSKKCLSQMKPHPVNQPKYVL